MLDRRLPSNQLETKRPKRKTKRKRKTRRRNPIRPNKRHQSDAATKSLIKFTKSNWNIIRFYRFSVNVDRILSHSFQFESIPFISYARASCARARSRTLNLRFCVCRSVRLWLLNETGHEYMVLYPKLNVFTRWFKRFFMFASINYSNIRVRTIRIIDRPNKTMTFNMETTKTADDDETKQRCWKTTKQQDEQQNLQQNIVQIWLTTQWNGRNGPFSNSVQMQVTGFSHFEWSQDLRWKCSVKLN